MGRGSSIKQQERVFAMFLQMLTNGPITLGWYREVYPSSDDYKTRYRFYRDIRKLENLLPNRIKEKRAPVARMYKWYITEKDRLEIAGAIIESVNGERNLRA
jgi:hypothetical protein